MGLFSIGTVAEIRNGSLIEQIMLEKLEGAVIMNPVFNTILISAIVIVIGADILVNTIREYMRNRAEFYRMRRKGLI